MSQKPTTVHVDLGPRGYDIEIGSGLLPSLGSFVASRGRLTHAAIIADSNVTALADCAAKSLAQTGARISRHSIPSGESSKSVASAQRLWGEMLDSAADRTTAVVAVGGGVTGDLAGFIAATFARGLSYFQVPTTLLADVDSSVGGKVGVNLPHAKNMVGAFWQPTGVLIDLDSLLTLPDREYRAGMAEVVKYGMILDAEFFHYLESHIDAINGRDPAALNHVVARCCRLKAEVVASDERETTGQRAVLNYGHTFGHAVEAIAGYGEFLHGEAVSIGMVCAARLARILGRIDVAVENRQRTLLSAFGLPVQLPALDTTQWIDSMRHDKKVEHGELRFVLPVRLGHVELVANVAVERVREVLAGVDS